MVSHLCVEGLQNKGDFTREGIADSLIIRKEDSEGSINYTTFLIPTGFFPGEVAYYRLISNNIPVKSTYQLQRHRCHGSAVEYLQAILLLMRASFEYFLYDIKPFMMLSLNTKKQVKKNHQQAANE